MLKGRARRSALCLAVALVSFLICRADMVGNWRLGPAVFVIALCCGLVAVMWLLGE